jgi:putative transposase
VREAVRGNGPVDKTGTAPRADFTTHTSHAMRALIAARDWLHVIRLPPYAPGLNPTEHVWSHLKRSLGTLLVHGIDHVVSIVKTWLKRIQYRPELIDAFFAHTGLNLELAPP